MLSILILALAFCTGCAGRYDITLSNGDVITAKGRPHFSKDKNVWLYTDASGKPSRISSGQVTQVAPQSMQNSDQQSFTPSIHKVN
jgi:hypothetical protein